MTENILTKKGAHYFGEESLDSEGKMHRHMAVLRGQGVLTLSTRELHFVQWVSKIEITIPIHTVVGVTYGRSHNGKSNLFTVLKISYVNELGETRIAGFQVGWKKDTLVWENAINKLLK